MNHDPWITHAARRAAITLTDGTPATLLGIPRHAGQRARIELPGGRQRTIPLTDIAHIEDPP
jgi:hypothetical protein